MSSSQNVNKEQVPGRIRVKIKQKRHIVRVSMYRTSRRVQYIQYEGWTENNVESPREKIKTTSTAKLSLSTGQVETVLQEIQQHCTIYEYNMQHIIPIHNTVNIIWCTICNVHYKHTTNSTCNLRYNASCTIYNIQCLICVQYMYKANDVISRWSLVSAEAPTPWSWRYLAMRTARRIRY